MTKQTIQKTIAEELNNTRVADRFILIRFSSSLPKQQAVNKLTTAEIAMTHGNAERDATAIDKLYGSELQTINSLIRQLRDLGRNMGFPYWQAGKLNTGVAMLPSSAYGQFFDRVQALNTALDNEVHRLTADWDTMLVRRSISMAGLFRPEQYPTADSFKSQVSAKYTVAPVPESSALQKLVSNMTGDAAAKAASQIAEIDADQKQALAESMQRQLEKFVAECRNIEKVLSADKPRIFSTLYDEVRSLVTGLNGIGFETITEAVAPILDVITEDPKDLVGEFTLQAETADKAKEAADAAEMLARQLAAMI